MTDITLPDRITTIEDLLREIPLSEPGKRILISFIFDYTPDSTEYADFMTVINSGDSYTYDMSLDPFYIYSIPYLEKKIQEWFTKMEEFNDSTPDDDDLALADGQSLQCIVDGFGTNQERISQFLQSIFTAIFTCQRSGGTDIWFSFCGQIIEGDGTSTISYSPTEVWMNQVESLEPDIAVIVNKDIKYFMGQTVNGNARVNSAWNTSGVGSIQSSSNYVYEMGGYLDRASCLAVIPVILHEHMRVRSQFKPIAYDFNGDGIVDGQDLDMQGSLGIDNLVSNGQLLISLPNTYSKFILLSFGDIRVRRESETRADDLSAPILTYINAAPAIGGFLSILGPKYGFRPVINKSLKQIDLYEDIDSDQIEVLVNNLIVPLRRTIRNGKVTLGSNRVYYRVPSDYISGYDDNNDNLYDMGRINTIILGNYIRNELANRFDGFIGGRRADVIAAAPTIIANILRNKPLQGYTYDIKYADIDSIELIIIIRMLNGVSEVSSSIIVGNLS